jgi:hypothetical protein
VYESVLESCPFTDFGRPVSVVDRKASNAKELVSGLVMVNNKLKRRTEVPQSGE